jgi:tetratricopeptide (TPR) repeat protein
MEKKQTLALINNAFNIMDNQAGLTLLRDYVQHHQDDVEQLYRLACVEEQMGSKDRARQAYESCLRLAPNVMIVYLYAGYFYQQQGELDKALILYSLGQDIDSKLVLLYRYEKVAHETKLRSHAADIALRAHFTELNKSALSSKSTVSIVHNAIWPQSHNKPFKYINTQQKPHLFYLPDLRAEEIFESSKLSWCDDVEKNYHKVLGEFEGLTSLVLEKGSPYLTDEYQMEGFEALSGSSNWTALHFYENGIANNQLIEQMPETAKLLQNIPLYCLNENPYEVFFSLLKPGQHIKPHFGLSNHSLTVHLPIVVPGNGYLRVADKKHVWEEGKLVVFDDSFEHEAFNHSDEVRIVLIFSIWHPDLSKIEQQDIKDCFNARSDWLAKRSETLNSIKA